MAHSKLRSGPGVKILDEPLTSIAAFENWKHSVLYSLRLDGECNDYIDIEFGKKTKNNPHRDLQNDPATKENGKTAARKAQDVDFMLAQIANFCPKIPRNDIIKDCKSLNEVWQVIRLHSNIETSGALLNDVWNITRKTNGAEKKNQWLYGPDSKKRMTTTS